MINIHARASTQTHRQWVSEYERDRERESEKWKEMNERDTDTHFSPMDAKMDFMLLD